jgi:hypothetical protein
VVFDRALQNGILLDDDSESGESSYLCKSDCSHCEALQLKENASLIINRKSLDYKPSLNDSKLSRGKAGIQVLQQQVDITRRAPRYYISEDDKNYARYSKQINKLNETSLNLDNCDELLGSS